ncbi:hypothetical protein SAMN05216201_11766 [Pseudomonas linyingensis]|uniref:DUF6285 domain-containing protein n=1 Tax=Pseudomonas linyingensis TaxID=915471 RepID=A0A1H7BHE0_9PSED|nr:DUF6285 domain-containing protein [Pseudomonas linyingensis]SEJ77153.1 hypothetical protein SAMN05216201_11766 [Pseudomonas linyingensis]
MRDYPTGAQLLESAEALLRAQLLPALPAEQKQNALMIAKAMGIAARQLQTGEQAEREELAALQTLLQIAAGLAQPGAEALRAQLVEANRQLGRLIRQGGADAGDTHAQVFRHLEQVARQKVAESNPRYLQRGTP